MGDFSINYIILYILSIFKKKLIKKTLIINIFKRINYKNLELNPDLVWIYTLVVNTLTTEGQFLKNKKNKNLKLS
jgi:hypothetical protein